MKRILLGLLIAITALANTAYGQVGEQPGELITKGKNAYFQNSNVWAEGYITSDETVTGSDLAADDDLTVGDDATVGGDLDVTGALDTATLEVDTLTVNTGVVCDADSGCYVGTAAKSLATLDVDTATINTAVVCDTAGGCALGTAALGPNELYLTDSTNTVQLWGIVDASNGYLGTKTAHPFFLMYAGASIAQINASGFVSNGDGSSDLGTSSVGWGGLYLGDSGLDFNIAYESSNWAIGSETNTALHFKVNSVENLRLGVAYIRPINDGAFELGQSSNGWSALHVSDGTVRGRQSIVSSEYLIGTTSAHNLSLMAGGVGHWDLTTGAKLIAGGSAGIDLGGFATNTLEIPNHTTLPATCNVGEEFLDTDSDDCVDTGGGDGAKCICKTANTWALVKDI